MCHNCMLITNTYALYGGGIYIYLLRQNGNSKIKGEAQSINAQLVNKKLDTQRAE